MLSSTSPSKQKHLNQKLNLIDSLIRNFTIPMMYSNLMPLPLTTKSKNSSKHLPSYFIQTNAETLEPKIHGTLSNSPIKHSVIQTKEKYISESCGKLDKGRSLREKKRIKKEWKVVRCLYLIRPSRNSITKLVWRYSWTLRIRKTISQNCNSRPSIERWRSWRQRR